MSTLKNRKRGRRWEPPPRRIWISLACNHPENGCFSGWVEAISFPSEFLELETYFRPRRLRDEGDHIVLSGKRWPVLGSKGYYGNWCWDAYFFEPRVAVAFLQWLRQRQLFCAGMGWSEVFEWFKGERELDPEALRHLLFEAEKDRRP